MSAAGQNDEADAAGVAPIEGSKNRIARILSLGLPIVGGMVSQNVFNLVDTAMVGTLGDGALAAVGTAAFLSFLSISVMMGLSSGVQAIAARRVGEGNHRQSAVPLNGALLLVAVAGIPMTALYYGSTPWVFPLVNSRSEVVELAVPYLQLRLLGLPAVAVNLAFRGYWNGVDRSKVYLQTLLVMHVCNILLNYGLIFGRLGLPEMGTAGAGLGSAVASYVGAGLYVLMGFRHARQAGFLRRLPGLAVVRDMLRLAVPGGVQQFLFAAGYTALFWILGLVGTEEAAAANVVINLMLVAFLPAMGLGMAAATLVGQALGRGDADDAARWATDVAKVTFVLLLVVGAVMVSLPGPLLSAFIHTSATRSLATLPLQIFGVGIALDGVGIVLMYSMIGAGAVRMALMVSVGCQWLLFLPGAYWVGPVLGYGITGIWLVQVGYRLVQTTAFVVAFKAGHWKTIKL